MATFYKQTYKLTIKARTSIDSKKKRKDTFDLGDREVVIKISDPKADPKYSKVKGLAERILRNGDEITNLALVEIEEFTQ